MSFTIQTNVDAMVAQENLRVNGEFQSRTIQHLTSGYRINQSGDDAAGLSVANKYRSDIAELTQGVRNANDGISTLQIVDGGLNTISKIVDRLRTLATQAATTTFTGNRTVLDNEFQALKGEIDRQAANIGLNSGGANNTLMQIYIGGGGANQSNSKVQVDLSGSANQVTASGLGLSGATLLSGGTAVGSKDIRTATLLSGSATQVFTFQLGGTSVAATVTGTVAGITGDNAVSQLNSQLNGSGISAYVDSSTGILNFTSTAAYTVTAAAASSAGTGAATDSATAYNTAMYSASGATPYVNVAAGHTEQLTFVKDGVSTVVTLNETNGGSIDAAIGALNTALRGTGITALKTAGAGPGITFQSAGLFSVARSSATAGEGVYAANQAATNASAPTASGTATANALSSLTALVTATSNLSLVQGKVGTGQNKLQYAVVLAQGQISNYSAAESRIRDADVAQEAANLTKAQVLQQASMAAMAQANAAPQAVMALLRG